jgi:hypothetical protein
VEIEQALYQRLAATSALTDLVGDRIYPDEADPDAARPLVVYAVVSKNESRDLAGNVVFATSAANIFVEADTFAVAKAVASAVNGALDRQAFAGVQRAYRNDYLTNEAEDGRSEILQTYSVIQ